jgi:hypothetical protein
MGVLPFAILEYPKMKDFKEQHVCIKSPFKQKNATETLKCSKQVWKAENG